MKLTKDKINSLVWILAILIILFTPIGFHLKVLVGKLFVRSADAIELSEQQTMTEYHWNLQGMDGGHFNFEANKGKVVLVNFWATWCPPCVAEMPSLSRLYDDYKDKVVFAFVTDDDKDKIDAFMKRKNYRFPVYYEASKTPDVLLSRSIPATYIISKSGKIVVKEIGAAKWDAQSTKDILDQLLAE